MVDEIMEGTQETQPEAKPELELTPREVAIAKGEDPDAIETPQEESIEGETAKDGGTDAGEPSGGKEAAGPAWIKGDVEELAASYGLSAEELREFSGIEEFQRFARIMDQRALGPKEKATETSDNEAVKTDTESADEIDPALYEKEGYDEPTLKLVKSHKALMERAKKLEETIATWQQQQAQAAESHQARSFHEAVDGLDEKVFGRLWSEEGGEQRLNAAQDAAREKLFYAARRILDDSMARGDGKAPPLKVVLNRAYQAAFADEIRQRETNEYHQRVAAQSRQRKPAPGRSRSIAPQEEAEMDETARVANHPAVAKAWEKLTGQGV